MLSNAESIVMIFLAKLFQPLYVIVLQLDAQLAVCMYARFRMVMEGQYLANILQNSDNVG